MQILLLHYHIIITNNDPVSVWNWLSGYAVGSGYHPGWCNERPSARVAAILLEGDLPGPRVGRGLLAIYYAASIPYLVRGALS